jgi:hypothetical protein
MAKRIPKEHEDAMIETYLNGATLEQATAPLGYDKTTCSNVLKRRGIAIRDRHIPKEHEDAMIAAYLAGSIQEEASALFGYHKTTCANVLKLLRYLVILPRLAAIYSNGVVLLPEVTKRCAGAMQ